MTASRDGSTTPRVSGLSRRRLLASLGGIGAVGAASGAGTFAYLSDRETLASNDIGTGTLDLLINGNPADGPVTLDVSGIDRGASGAETLDFRVQTNAARVWLATDCPEDDDLAEALDVRLAVDDRPVSGDWKSFAAFRRALVDGLRLDAGCLPPDEDVSVTLHWRLPGDVDDSLGGSRTEFAFRLYAEQCRHVPEVSARNPFAGRVCDESDEPEECPDCEEFGKADDIDGDLSVNDVVGLVDLPAGVGPHSIVVTDVEYKDGDEAVGVAFELADENGDPGPDVCRVEIKGGRKTSPYDISPPRPTIDKVLNAPESSGGDASGLAGISNVAIFVCIGDGSENKDNGPEAVEGDKPEAPGNSGNRNQSPGTNKEGN